MTNALLEAARSTGLLLAFRAFPLAAWALISLRLPARARVVAGGAFAVGAVAAATLGSGVLLLISMAGYGYYAALALGLNRISEWLERHMATRGATFLLLFSACIAIPAISAPGLAAMTFLPLGWECLLASYSYCVETSNGRTQRVSFRERLFFLLVNPTVVYTHRGSPISLPAPAREGWARAVFGVCIVLANVVVLRRFLQRHGSEFGMLTVGALCFATIYLSHSGLAHLQLGLVRECMWVAPERYDWPLHSRSPMEFWRRWNTYVRHWIEAYVLLPLAVAQSRRRMARVGPPAVVVVALLASGALHDAYAFFARLRPSLRGIEVFSMACVFVLGWRWLAQRRLVTSTAVRSVLGRTALWCVVAFLSARWWQHPR